MSAEEGGKAEKLHQSADSIGWRNRKRGNLLIIEVFSRKASVAFCSVKRQVMTQVYR